MTSDQARLFIDYVLGMQDRNGAADYIRFSAFRLDETFFAELSALSGEAASEPERKESLEWLMSVAKDARGSAYAPFALAARQKAAPQKTRPKTDYERAMALLELDSRVTAMMMRTHFNPVDSAIIFDWQNILDGYRDILDAGNPKTPLYTLESLRLKIAQTLESLARAHSALHDTTEAGGFYRQAAKAFDEAGAPEDAIRCRSRIVAEKLVEEADYDEQIRAAFQDLERLEKTQPEYFSRLVDLGELQAQAGDNHAAENTLQNARKGLFDARWGNPTGSALAESVVATLKGMHSGQNVSPFLNIQTNLLVRELHRRIHLGLAEVYQRLGDSKRSDEQLNLAEEMDRSSPDNEFSTTGEPTGTWIPRTEPRTQ